MTQNGASLTLDMAPTAQTAQTVDAMASIKWMGYCAPASGPISLAPCQDEEYWEALEQRYAALAPLPDDEDPEWVGARLQLAELYYTGLRSGFSANVQTGSVISFQYTLEDEDHTTTIVRAALQGVHTVPLLAGQTWNRIFPVPSATTLLETFKYASFLRREITRLQAAIDSGVQTRGGLSGALSPQQIASTKESVSVAKFLSRGSSMAAPVSPSPPVRPRSCSTCSTTTT